MLQKQAILLVIQVTHIIQSWEGARWHGRSVGSLRPGQIRRRGYPVTPVSSFGV